LASESFICSALAMSPLSSKPPPLPMPLLLLPPPPLLLLLPLLLPYAEGPVVAFLLLCRLLSAACLCLCL
jgi:hypothetical protein